MLIKGNISVPQGEKKKQTGARGARRAMVFRHLCDWFELHILSIFIVGGLCWFLGIVGVLNGISFGYTDRTSTLPSSATAITSRGLNAQPYTATT
jgi:hypothetical protein